MSSNGKPLCGDCQYNEATVFITTSGNKIVQWKVDQGIITGEHPRCLYCYERAIFIGASPIYVSKLSMLNVLDDYRSKM